MENADFIKLGEFRYREFQTISIRKVTKKTDELGVKFEWDHGQAIISHRGIRVADVLKFDVEEDSDWRKVEKGIERWLQENKKDVKVRLTVCYKTIGRTIPDTLNNGDGVTKKVYPSKVTNLRHPKPPPEDSFNSSRIRTQLIGNMYLTLLSVGHVQRSLVPTPMDSVTSLMTCTSK
jgi:6-phosphofructokinase